MLLHENRTRLRATTIALPADLAEPFVEAARRAGWEAEDTGERVTTEDGPDGEAVLAVAFPEPERAARRWAWPADVPQ